VTRLTEITGSIADFIGVEYFPIFYTIIFFVGLVAFFVLKSAWSTTPSTGWDEPGWRGMANRVGYRVGQVIGTLGRWIFEPNFQKERNHLQQGISSREQEKSELHGQIQAEQGRSQLQINYMQDQITQLSTKLDAEVTEKMRVELELEEEKNKESTVVHSVNPELVALKKERDRLQQGIYSREQEKAELHRQMQAEQGMSQSQINQMQEQIKQLSTKLDAEATEKKRIELELGEEKNKASTVVHNVTYNIQDSAIAGDINANLKEKND